MSWKKTYIFSCLVFCFFIIMVITVDHFTKGTSVRILNLSFGVGSAISASCLVLWRKKEQEKAEISAIKRKQFAELLGKKGYPSTPYAG